MAKLRPNPIGAADLERYLATESDFDFELRVLHQLREFGLKCEHGGHYEDPVTKKSREFDIRVHASQGPFHLLAAIECKNLRPNFPLLVSCVPRTAEESWQNIVRKPAQAPNDFTGVDSISGDESLYAPSKPVGKSTVQVGLQPNGELLTNDSEVYEKWGQSLASLHGLASKINELPLGSYAIFLPIIVVPDNTLWYVLYSEDGQRKEGPKSTDRCSVYAGGYQIPLKSPPGLLISHVEFMTLGGLVQFHGDNLCDRTTMQGMILGGQSLD